LWRPAGGRSRTVPNEHHPAAIHRGLRAGRQLG
jgi:hypothetical protein